MRETKAEWPAETLRRVRSSWEREIKKFLATRPGCTAREREGWPAVYRDGRCLLWPGRVYALDSYAIGRDAVFRVSPVNYAWITARVRAARVLGAVTLTLTSDDRLILTVRGDGVNVYPGRLHGNGGNPDRIEPIEEHQIRETVDELFVRRSEIVRGSMFFGGVAENLQPRFQGKPLLCGWLRLKLTAREVERRVRSRPLSEREPDAVDVESIELSRAAFERLLSRKRLPLCPPGASAVAVLGRHLFNI